MLQVFAVAQLDEGLQVHCESLWHTKASRFAYENGHKSLELVPYLVAAVRL